MCNSPILPILRPYERYLVCCGIIYHPNDFKAKYEAYFKCHTVWFILDYIYKQKLRLSSQTISVNNPFNSTNMTNMGASKPLIDQEEYFLYVRQIGLHCTTDGYVSHTLSLLVFQGYLHLRSKPPFRYMLSNILVGLAT